MTYVAGIYVPDDVYSSLLSVIQTEQNALKSTPIGFLCNPIIQAILGPTNPTFALCLSAEALISVATAKIASLVNQTEQQLVQTINQLQAQGEKVTSITFTIKGENTLAQIIKSMTVIPNPISSWSISQITNLEMQALQAGVNQFNSTTLYKINQQLVPEGWQLNPISLSYDSSSNMFVITATYQKMHTPDPQAWMILVIVIILAIVALAYIITNYSIQTQKIQYQKTVAQNAYQLYQQCLQETNNNVQLCEQLLNNYLKGTQLSTTSDILLGLGIAAALAGVGILVYSLGKSRGS